MKNNYILIDYENVQPESLAPLNGHPFKVIVFVGSNQSKLPFQFAASLQQLGDQAEYVKMDGNGSNALDFHIAFYMGQIAERDADAYFHIISKDKGFDPLIKHLKTKRIFAQREKSLSEIPYLRISKSTSKEEKVEAIVQSLTARGHARPRKVKTLANTINSLFLKTLGANEIAELIKQLVKQKCISIEEERVIYHPPIIQH